MANGVGRPLRGTRRRGRQRRDARDRKRDATNTHAARPLRAQDRSDPEQQRGNHCAGSQQPATRGRAFDGWSWRLDRILQRCRVFAPKVRLGGRGRRAAIAPRVAIGRWPERDQLVERSDPVARKSHDDATLDRLLPTFGWIVITGFQLTPSRRPDTIRRLVPIRLNWRR